MSNTVEPSQDERSMAKTGVSIQAQAAGLDLEDPKVSAFLEVVAENEATNMAWRRFFNNILNSEK